MNPDFEPRVYSPTRLHSSAGSASASRGPISARVRQSRVLLAFVAAVTAAIASACGSESSTSTGPSPTKCQIGLEVSPPSFAAGGGAGTMTISAQPECAWTAAVQANWITELSPTSGQGNAQVTLRVGANPQPSTRQGEITVNENRVSITQQAAACAFAIAPTSRSAGSDGDTATVEVTADAGCTWTAVSNIPWASITSGATGSGNGSVGFTVAANSGAARAGTLTIAGQTFTLTQGAVGCAYTISRTSQSVGAAGGPGSPIGVATTAICAWSASSNVPWITVTSGASGTGDGSVGFTVAANAGAARTGTLTIADQTFTVTQAAGTTPCAYTITPASQSVGAAGGAGTPVAVATTAGCAWTATSTVAWITVTSGAAGTGNGSVGFTVAANTGAARTGTVTIADQTFTVTQAAGTTPCAYTITPASQSVGSAGGAGTPVAVATTASCAWTATSTVSWITVTSGAAGTGNGSVAFSIGANTGLQRIGTLTIAGQTFTVTQAPAQAACTYTIAPTSQSFGTNGGTGSLAVTAPAGCTWTPATGTPWITITSGATGSGNGSVGFTVAPNPGAERTGTVTTAGQTFTVTQAAAPKVCSYTVSPLTQTLDRQPGVGTITVVTSTSCEWTASSGASWITVTSGASGTGNGSVTFRVDVNLLTTRTGTLSVAGQTVTVIQRGLLP